MSDMTKIVDIKDHPVYWMVKLGYWMPPENHPATIAYRKIKK